MTPLSAVLVVVLSQSIVLEGQLDGGADYELISFEVPAGIKEFSVTHPSQDSQNILDYGLWGPDGFRGYGGGNSEPFVVGETGASRSYLPGAITPGTWQVMIGKAQVKSAPPRYRLEIELRATQTLPEQPRAPLPAVELSTEARWYAGDFHVHTEQSGDAHPTMQAAATFARSRGLDFVEFSEHNTSAGVGLIAAVQSASPALLIVPGEEFTTYKGHANAIGLTTYVDHRIGLDGRTLEAAISEIHTQGALFALNHPKLDLGDSCIGCAWKWPLPDDVDAMELGTGGWAVTGPLFTLDTIAWWEQLSKQGRKIVPIGGSDDHEGGVGSGITYSPIGNPTTMVYAKGLSVAAIMEGVRLGHTVVKLGGPSDPMLEFTINGRLPGDEVFLSAGTLTAVVTGGDGQQLVVLREGEEYARAPITGSPFTFTRAINETGRFRAYVEVDGHPRTVTNNLWVSRPIDPPGCGCDAGGGALIFAALAWLVRKRAWRAGA